MKRTGQMEKNNRPKRARVDYRTALPAPKKWLLFLMEGIGIAAAVDELFYRELPAMLPLLALAGIWAVRQKKQWQKKRREQLVRDFREALNAIAVSVRSGLSVENAVPEAVQALNRTIGGERDMTRELAGMAADIRIGIPAENLFLDFAKRSGSDEIQDFAAAFAAAKRMGGNLSRMIRKTADQIGTRIEAEQEIQTILAAKKLEQRIMSLMPCGIIAYLQLTSPDYLAVLYHNAAGAVFMTVCLTGWLMAAAWGSAMLPDG